MRGVSNKRCLLTIFIFHAQLAEHEIFFANKYENTNNSWYFHIY